LQGPRQVDNRSMDAAYRRQPDPLFLGAGDSGITSNRASTDIEDILPLPTMNYAEAE